MKNGIYILANDVVYDQLVALLNSIEVNAGDLFPVCILPYDDRLDKIRQEIQTRENVFLFEDQACIDRWETFVREVWETHPIIKDTWRKNGVLEVYRMGMHRRFCAFEGMFENFIYLDADILVLNSLEPIFNQLSQSDCVVYDFQYKDPTHVYNVGSEKLLETFTRDRISSEIFCAGLYGSKRGIFSQEDLDRLLKNLSHGEVELLYSKAPDQTIVNYMMMRSNRSIYNFALELPADQSTGCCVTSLHFKERDHLLYDQGNRLTYLHYIGLASSLFSQLCAGKTIDFPYQDIFLHYRYLHEPENRPALTNRFINRILQKLQLARQGISL
ncbi:sugar transferase [Phormidesmis priestleyi ULC007]|uniref:Sugar transferase n=1 Tax=Phormidesmis priestleyi ULC007 TaxID=1920490 RepID=A0A2T1DHL1_9CYAN|nr:Npun_R2821/Npun_R2822 family protein [Phormidesmis priestleyi]PSB19957.1 sugar transferase [Phormidesmis priestleyi ULC007]PZO50345.1 MAG: sugar transferase [Phormidesmis priestleyi]